MNNLQLFELINAAPGLGRVPLALAIGLATWVIYLVPLTMTIAWVRGDDAARRELLQLLLAVAIALCVSRAVSSLWPHPRPFALHYGMQYLAHADNPGLPSHHVTVFWSLALAALGTRRFSMWALPLLAVGLLVGWSRVFLGIHFPFDVLAALPVGLAGAAIGLALRKPALPAFARILATYSRAEKQAVSVMGRLLNTWRRKNHASLNAPAADRR